MKNQFFLDDQVIESARLRLRKPRKSDAEKLFYKYTSDFRVTKYSTWKAHSSLIDAETFVDFCLRKWAEGDEYNFIVEIKDTSEIVGMYKVKLNGTSTNVGYVFAFDSWGKGFATEATQTMINYLFTHTEISVVDAFCDEENKASEKVMIKSGMKFVKMLPSFVIHPNISSEKRDCLLYRISKEDYGKRTA